MIYNLMGLPKAISNFHKKIVLKFQNFEKVLFFFQLFFIF